MRNFIPATMLLVGCNSYDLFQSTGFQQESFSAKADILFVIDNSDSMQSESESLATSFAGFVNSLLEQDVDFPSETLSDAVTNYAGFVGNRDSFVNFQMGITTTDVTVGRGDLYGTGRLTRLDDDVPEAFARNLLCESTCFEAGSLPNGSGSCGDPLGNEVTEFWLACECGDTWTGNCGGADEEPLEAVFLAMCRSVPNPPGACFSDPALFDADAVGSLAGFLRPNSTFIPVIVTDEGDGSRRIEGNEAFPGVYADLFNQFNKRMVFSVIGPDREEGGGFPCPTGASDWGTLRLNYFVEKTNGLHVSITDEANGCAGRDFNDSLQQLGDLLNNLNKSFRLQALPVTGSIVVKTSDGGTIQEADELGVSDAGVALYGDGWSYDPPTNTVLLHGEAIPDFDGDVTVYYLPQDGNPRNLPF